MKTNKMPGNGILGLHTLPSFLNKVNKFLLIDKKIVSKPNILELLLFHFILSKLKCSKFAKLKVRQW